ncbi:adenylosuccinate lyase [Streptomyces sp. CdTB01]|uniref:adenylosuccinate lyase n=1 Tax=Streptomyces sp. CdTB01 TaxID=1725411 RepID=UPI0007C85F83|nr:adenylosuccinate lyase [Streptomyces sp. CdTB01]
MIARYTLPEMAGLFTDSSRYATWVRVEILASEAQAALGHVPHEAVADMRRARVPAPERVAALERERDHEVLSFLAAYCEGIPDSSARFVHLGMTSYDLVDTALGHTLTRATDLLTTAARRLRRILTGRALEHWDTVMVGRTHGMHAEPTTFGHKLAGHAFAVDRCLHRLAAARQAVAVGTISGSVGTYALIDPRVEDHVCTALGLTAEPAPSQVVARDRHAQLLQAVATLGACIEHLALELRLLQRTEVREVEEARTSAYQGSSAMPHKRNPTTSERLCGLARLLRGYADTALENVALWHERDLAHQSVERVILPDSLCVGHFQATRAGDLVAALTVDADRMRAHIDHTDGLIYSSSVLAELLGEGMEREHAYRSVQAAANHTLATGEHFAASLAKEGIDLAGLGPERFLSHHDVIRTRLEKLHELQD